MATTSRFQHPYPNRFTTEWWSEFVSTMSSLDAADFEARDERSLITLGGGTISVSATGVVSWTEDIKLIHGLTGVVCTVAAGSVTLEDGAFAHATVARGSTSSYTSGLTINPALVPQGASPVVIFARQGNEVWMRHRGLVSVGSALESGFVQGVDVLRRRLQIVTNITSGIETVVFGRVRLNPSELSLLSEASIEYKLVVEAQVTTPGQTANISFHDVTAAPVVISSYVESQPVGNKTEIVFSPIALTERVYELRGGLDSASGPYLPSDLVQVWQAYIEVSQSF